MPVYPRLASLLQVSSREGFTVYGRHDVGNRSNQNGDENPDGAMRQLLVFEKLLRRLHQTGRTLSIGRDPLKSFASAPR